jgi:hypothetical protein
LDGNPLRTPFAFPLGAKIFHIDTGGVMLRGAEKRMIVVRTRDSRMFEEAYFVVRPEVDRGMGTETDMLREANRILEGSAAENRYGRIPCPEVPRCGSGLLRGLVWFFLGLLTGGGSVGLLWVLL